MPAYSTPDLVREVLSRSLTDFEGTGAALDDVQIQSEIDAAQAEIDARLAGRYTTPFTSTPPLVVSLCADIAAYRSNLRWRQSEDLTAEDPMVLRYTNAIDLLKDLASGRADLPGIGTADGNSTTGIAYVVNPYQGRVFSLRDFNLGYRDTYGNRTSVDPHGW